MITWRDRQELEYLAEAQKIGRKVARLGLPMAAARALDIFRPPRDPFAGLTGWDIKLHGDNVRVDSHDPNLAYKPSTVHWRDTNVTIIGNGPVHSFSHCWYYEVIVKRIERLPVMQSNSKVILPEDPAGLTLGLTSTNPDNLTAIPGSGSWTLPGTVLVGYDGQISVTESVTPHFTTISSGWSPSRNLAVGRRVGVFIPAHGSVRHRLFLVVDGRVMVRGPKVPFDITATPVWPVVEILGTAQAVTLVHLSALTPPTYQLAACTGDENDRSVEEEIEEARVCCQWGVAGRNIRLLAERKMAVIALDERKDEKLPLGGRVVVGNGPVREFTDGVKYFEIKIKMLQRRTASESTAPPGRRFNPVRQKASLSLSIGYHMSPQGINRIPQVCHLRELPNTNFIDVEHPAVPLALSTRIGLLLSRKEKILALFADGQLQARMDISCAALLDPTSSRIYPVVELGKGIWAISFVASAGPPKEAAASIELSNRNNAAVMIQRFVRRRRKLRTLERTIIEAQARDKRLMETAQEKSMRKEKLESLLEMRRLMRQTKDILSNIQQQNRSLSPVGPMRAAYSTEQAPDLGGRNEKRSETPKALRLRERESRIAAPIAKTQPSTPDIGDNPSGHRKSRSRSSLNIAKPTTGTTAQSSTGTTAQSTTRTTAQSKNSSRRYERRTRNNVEKVPRPKSAEDRDDNQPPDRPRRRASSEDSRKTILWAQAGEYNKDVSPSHPPKHHSSLNDPRKTIPETQPVSDEIPTRTERNAPTSDEVETIPHIRSGCRSFLYPSPWRFVLVSKDCLHLSRRKGAESSTGNIAMGAQPLKRHDQFLAFFFSVKVETLLPGFPDGLAIGVTASTPDEIKTDIAAGKPLAKSAEDVLDTFIVGLRGRMYSPFWEHKSRHCEWSGTLENGLQGGSVVTLVVGLNSRIYIFVDGRLVDIKCPSGVPQRDSAPVYPIVELSGQAHVVKLIPDAELPRAIALVVAQHSEEPVSDEDNPYESESSYSTSSSGTHSRSDSRESSRSATSSNPSRSSESESQMSRSSSSVSNSQSESPSSEGSSESSSPGFFEKLLS